jgi:hypothetical protein
MIFGITLMENKNELVEEVKHLDKRSQVELLRSLMQQLETEVVQEAAKDAVVQVNLGSNNTNGSTATYSDLVINLYCNESDVSILSNLLDAAAYRLRNKGNPRPVEG